MAKTIVQLSRSRSPMRSNYLREASRLEALDKAVKKAYGVIFDFETLRNFDMHITGTIDIQYKKYTS